MTDVFLYAAARTPFGRVGGALAEVRPDDLAATAVTGVIGKTPNLDPAEIGDVVWGSANGASEDNRNVGRMAVLLSGLPISVSATTVNRLCGSSLDAAMIASRTVETSGADIVLAGGVESMTRAPWVLPKPSRAFPRKHHRGLHHPGVAAGQPAHACGVDYIARGVQRAARRSISDIVSATGRVRCPLPHPCPRGMASRPLRQPGRTCTRRRPHPRRGD